MTLDLAFPFLMPIVDSLLRPFAADEFKPQISIGHGTIKSFDSAEVLRSVSPLAKAAGRMDDLAELYALGEQSWLVDERWGICWLNLLKRQWRSWLLPTPTFSAAECVDAAILWPMAQLLKIRGLHLIPAISIQRDGWGALVLSPYSIDREMDHLAKIGFSIIGPRWSALVEKQGRIQLLDFPPNLSRTASSQNPSSPAGPVECQAVFIIEAGRRLVTHGRILAKPEEAAERIRRAWPMIDLPIHHRRIGDVAGKLARQCRCIAVDLSKKEEDFLQLIESSRRRWGDARKIEVTVGAAIRRKNSKVRASAGSYRV